MITLFNNLIDAIANQLVENGFRRRSKNVLKKSADNKDITFEIHFQANLKCFGEYFQILPIIAVYSKQLKKEDECGFGQIYQKQVLNCQNKVWSVSETSFDDDSLKIIDAIKNNLLQIINDFDKPYI